MTHYASHGQIEERDVKAIEEASADYLVMLRAPMVAKGAKTKRAR